MKLVHTADWHLGKYVNGVSMLADQAYFLEELLKLIKEEKADALLVSGDIYDRSIPPTDAVLLFNEFLNKLQQASITAFFITGNHDSAKRLHFASGFLEEKNIYIESMYTETIKKVSVDKNGQTYSFFLLPYLDYYSVKQSLDETVTGQNDAYRVYLDHNREHIKEEEINILLAHGFFAYTKEPKTSDSELRVGPSELVSANFFEWFDYAALGHIHAPQSIGKDNYRYSGSILKYSIDEANQQKSVTIVDIAKKGQVNVTQRVIVPKRDLVVLSGTMDELLQNKEFKQNREHYVFADILEDNLIFGAMDKLKQVYPNILGLRFQQKTAREHIARKSVANLQSLSTEELFSQFYEDMTDEEIPKDRLQIVRKAIEKGAAKE